MVTKDQVKKEVVDRWNAGNESKIDEAILNQYLSDDQDNEVVEFYQKHEREIFLEIAKKEQAQIRSNINQILGDKIVRNKGMNNCPLCVLSHPDIDFGIFFMNWNDMSVNNALSAYELDLRISNDVVTEHFEHIFVESEISNKQKEMKRELLEVESSSQQKFDVNDIQLLTYRINVITATLNKMERDNLTWTRQYKELSSNLKEYIELKSKIVDGEKHVLEGKLEVTDLLKQIMQ